jgi:hypothetical protein
MMMLNSPTFVEHNNDSNVNGTNLRCSPPKSSNQCFEKQNPKFSKKRPGHYVINHVLHAVDLYVTLCG